MLAIISLFVYILKYPTLESAQSDIALLDMGSGHFGQIHHLTSGHVSFKLPREVAVLAYKAVKRAGSNKACVGEESGSGVEAARDHGSDPNSTAVSAPTLFKSADRLKLDPAAYQVCDSVSRRGLYSG